MRALSEAMRRRRHERGALSLDIPKLSVIIDANGDVEGLGREERDPSHSLIEDFMLAANEAVATFFKKKRLPLAARLHPQPDEEKFEIFKLLLAAVNVGFRGGPDSKSIQRLVKKIEGDPLAPVIQLALLRTMGHAEYQLGQGIHFALATESYCHFTSPIRRYPDLLIHQMLDLYLGGGLRSARERQSWKERLPRLLEHASDVERRAESAEREMVKLRLVRYLRPMIGEEMDARIASLHAWGFYVRVDETLIEGLVHNLDTRRRFLRARQETASAGGAASWTGVRPRR